MDTRLRKNYAKKKLVYTEVEVIVHSLHAEIHVHCDTYTLMVRNYPIIFALIISKNQLGIG